MRRVVLSAVAAVALMAGTAAASWDYFPPKDAGSGEAKLGFEFGMPMEKVTTMALSVGARYSIIDGLEASLKLPVPLMLSFDGESVDDYAGLSVPVIGVRYWLPMGLGFFLDAYLPVDTREDLEPAMMFGVGVQYSMDFTDELSFGSELGLLITLPKDDYTKGMDLGIGLELGYNLGMVTPYLGLDMIVGLTDDSFDGKSLEETKTEFGLGLEIGASFAINEMLGAGVFFKINDLLEEDNTPMTIGATFSINF